MACDQRFANCIFVLRSTSREFLFCIVTDAPRVTVICGGVNMAAFGVAAFGTFVKNFLKTSKMRIVRFSIECAICNACSSWLFLKSRYKLLQTLIIGRQLTLFRQPLRVLTNSLFSESNKDVSRGCLIWFAPNLIKSNSCSESLFYSFLAVLCNTWRQMAHDHTIFGQPGYVNFQYSFNKLSILAIICTIYTIPVCFILLKMIFIYFKSKRQDQNKILCPELFCQFWSCKCCVFATLLQNFWFPVFPTQDWSLRGALLRNRSFLKLLVFFNYGVVYSKYAAVIVFCTFRVTLLFSIGSAQQVFNCFFEFLISD